MMARRSMMVQRGWYKAGALFFSAGLFCGVALAQQAGDAATGKRLYDEGQYAQALPFITRAAEAGDAEAQHRLCLMLRQGQGVKKPDAKQAYAWCRKAAEQGYGPAEYETAASLQSGMGADKDMAAALDYYMRASRQGVPEAQYALGRLYESGEGGVTQSYYQARTLYMWASGKGYAPATYRVGTLYEDGRGVRPSMAAALRWYRKAASMGSEEALARLEALKKQEEEMEAAVRAAEAAGDGR